MKRIILIVIVGILFFVNLPQISAQEINVPSPSPSPTPIEYQLPYPGILPDSSLYGIKTFRDRIVSFFIADPIKKAEFNLLQSDKRINAAVYLFAKSNKKPDLIHSVISKALNYFNLALQQGALAKKTGIETKDLFSKMSLALEKYEEILKDMQKNSQGELKNNLGTDLKRVQDYQNTVKGLNPQ